jgi:hypothetical protein
VRATESEQSRFFRRVVFEQGQCGFIVAVLLQQQGLAENQ